MKTKSSIQDTYDEEDRKISQIVIGICGKPGAGKDTLGGYLQNHFGFDAFALKTPIEKVVQTVFNVDNFHLYDRDAREQPLVKWPDWTVRKMLQAVGQSMRDIAGGDIWAKSLCNRMEANKKVVITDIRTPEDIKCIRGHIESKGGSFILVMVKRPGFGATTSGGFANHKLESYNLEPECDIVLDNNGTENELFEQAKKYLKTQDVYPLVGDTTMTRTMMKILEEQ